VIWTVAVTFTALLLFVGSLLVRAKRQGPTSGVGAFVGQEAVASEPIRPDQPGRVFFDGAYWNAASDVEIAEGATVRVDAVDGLTLRVSPLETERNASP
jgi:membrane-bound serine protease (ClpP class)